MDYAETIQRWQNVKDFAGNTKNVYDILNDKSKGRTNPSEGVKLEETSNNAIAHDDVLAESINNHESQRWQE